MAKTKDTTPKTGRPTVVTETAIAKLEQAFSLSCTDQEACLHADITMDNLYYHQRKNPDFAIRKAKLKQQAILKAKMTLIKSLDQVENAKWYLERKAKNEYSKKIETQITEDPANIRVTKIIINKE